MNKIYNLLLFTLAFFSLNTNSIALAFEALCEYKSPSDYNHTALRIKLKKNDGHYLYIFNNLANFRGYISDAPDQKLNNLDLWYRINNPNYDKKGPERPFRSLDVCIDRETETGTETEVNIFYRENNKMVWIDIDAVMANDVCGTTDEYSINHKCTFYPNGKNDDPFANSDTDINDETWTVRLTSGGTIDIPAVIQGIPVRLLRGNFEIFSMGASAKEFILVGGSGLLVPKWWVDEYNFTREDYYEPRLSGEVWDYKREDYDHAGNKFNVTIEPRFEAKVHYYLDKSRYSNLHEDISLKPLSTNLDLDLFQFNEFDINCKEYSGCKVDATYELPSGYIQMLGSEKKIIAKHSVKENTEYRIGPEFIGLNSGLLSTLTDDTATTRDILKSYPGDYGGLSSNAWIWLWEDAASSPLPIEISFITSPLINPGDLNNDGCVDRSDLTEELLPAIRNGSDDLKFDLNGDSVVNIADARYLVTLFSYPGGLACP